MFCTKIFRKKFNRISAIHKEQTLYKSNNWKYIKHFKHMKKLKRKLTFCKRGMKRKCSSHFITWCSGLDVFIAWCREGGKYWRILSIGWGWEKRHNAWLQSNTTTTARENAPGIDKAPYPTLWAYWSSSNKQHFHKKLFYNDGWYRYPIKLVMISTSWSSKKWLEYACNRLFFVFSCVIFFTFLEMLMIC